MLIIGMLCLGVAMGAGAYYLNRKNISLALISIGVDFARACCRRRRHMTQDARCRLRRLQAAG
jgi:hypothetical protein